MTCVVCGGPASPSEIRVLEKDESGIVIATLHAKVQIFGDVFDIPIVMLRCADGRLALQLEEHLERVQ